MENQNWRQKYRKQERFGAKIKIKSSTKQQQRDTVKQTKKKE